MSAVRVAAAQYPIEFLGQWGAFEAKLTQLVAEAAGQGAQLLVLPEYASMELASLFPEDVYTRLDAQLAALQQCHGDYLALHTRLAQQHRVHILAGSFPVRDDSGAYRNRAYLCGPNGSHGWQEKLQMTRFENERWQIQRGSALKVFDTALGVLAVNICYDVEFPLIARAQAEAGARIILAPSCTDTLAGYHRVRIGCQARALENQCYVIQAPTVGEAPWSEAVDINVGAAAVYTPVDRGFPDDGVLTMGELNRTQWVYADLNLAAIDRVRAEGQVFNYRDWERQCAAVACAPLRVVIE